MHNVTKITLIILFFTLITSCNSVKRLGADDYLLKKNTIIVNGERDNDIELHSYIQQRPNTSLRGAYFGIYIFNLAKPDFEETYEAYMENHPRTTKFISDVFSKKQVKILYNFNKDKNNYFKRSGEKPVVIENKRTKKSVNSLIGYYKNKGYFDVQVRSEEEIKGNKKKKITYIVTTNKPYYLAKISSNIESSVLYSIYKKHLHESHLKEGVQFNATNFAKEENRLINLFRNSGVYNFGKDMMHFDVNMTDSTSYKKNIKLRIDNPILVQGNKTISVPFKIQKVNKINVYTDFSFNTKDDIYTDSSFYKGYTFYAHKKLKFNAAHLSKAIVISPDDVYKDEEKITTKQYLNDLKIFRSPINIEYIENEDGSLTANIKLTPTKKFGIDSQIDFTHSNIKPFGIKGKFGFYDKNIFKGSEIFKYSFQGSFLNVAEDVSDPNFNFFGLSSWEIGTNAFLRIPRIFFPFNTEKLIPKKMRPSTDIGASLSYQKNIGLDRQNISGNITYNWKSNNKVKHQFNLINVQYINNINSSEYFKIFGTEFIKLSKVAQDIVDSNSMNSEGQITSTTNYIKYVLNPINGFSTTDFDNYKIVQRIQERRNIITEDILVPVMSYGFTYNDKKTIKDNNFKLFNAKIISAGSITSALTKKNDEGRKVLFGLPVAQYIKTELEFIRYWNISNTNNLVFRTFIGAAIPFGNSNEIPFSRSYRAGGSNDIRAWRSFDLGPGATKSNLDFNIGNLKLVSNIEYRFKILNSFYSALFIDAGNVWDITKSDLTAPEAKFNGLNSLKDIAIGSGVGIRYDLGFLTLRLDTGFKTYEPYLEGNRWFKNYAFRKAVYNFGINYPF
ncbi:MAG: BamA/TamA family outer membrane protein [Flavobacteriaceae bacterium]